MKGGVQKKKKNKDRKREEGMTNIRKKRRK